MNWLRTAVSEFLGLFIDDAPFAAAIAVWLLACWLLLPRLPVPPPWPPVILFAGLAAILVRSAIRTARR